MAWHQRCINDALFIDDAVATNVKVVHCAGCARKEAVALSLISEHSFVRSFVRFVRSFVRCSLFVVRCSLFVVRCSLFVVRCSLFVVRCSLFVVRCSLFVFVVCCRRSCVGHTTLKISNTNKHAPCRLVVVSSCRRVVLPPCRLVVLSSFRLVVVPLCRVAAMSCFGVSSVYVLVCLCASVQARSKW